MIFERVLKQELLAVELLSDLGDHTHILETSEEKLKRFVQIFVYGMYVLAYSNRLPLTVRRYAVNDVL